MPLIFPHIELKSNFHQSSAHALCVRAPFHCTSLRHPESRSWT